MSGTFGPHNCRDEQCRSTGRCMAAPMACSAELQTTDEFPQRDDQWLQRDIDKAKAGLREWGVPGDWGDRRDEWSERIAAAHPLKTGDDATYSVAMRMVGNRHSKGALVELVNWLLKGQP